MTCCHPFPHEKPLAYQPTARVDTDQRDLGAPAHRTVATIRRAGPPFDLPVEAANAGISAKSVRRARETLGIKPEKSGFEGGWVWALPKMP